MRKVFDKTQRERSEEDISTAKYTLFRAHFCDSVFSYKFLTKYKHVVYYRDANIFKGVILYYLPFSTTGEPTNPLNDQITYHFNKILTNFFVFL